MARPQKNNCEYFPHLTTMRNHRKVKALRNKFGNILGYAFWSMFLEYLTELDGNEFEFSQIECEMFAAELGVSAAEIQSLINFCIDIELLFNDGSNFIYSDSLNDALKPVYEKRNRERDKSKARKRHENGSFSNVEYKDVGISAAEILQQPALPVEEIPQSRVNKTKVNKTIKEEAFFLNSFCESYFDKKYINQKTLETFDALISIDHYSIEEIKQAITSARGDPFWSKNFLSPKKLRE